MAQSYENLEIIIVNDGSTDNSDEVIKKIIQKNPAIKYLSVQNGGVSKARNLGIKEAHGKFVMPLDADDFIQPKYIELAVDEFVKDPDLIVVTSKAVSYTHLDVYKRQPVDIVKHVLEDRVTFWKNIL